MERARRMTFDMRQVYICRGETETKESRARKAKDIGIAIGVIDVVRSQGV